jgi:protein SCO1/2/putative membrane protein
MSSFPFSWPRFALAGALCFAFASSLNAAEDDLGPVGDFSLTERDGRTVTQADLLGKVWVASFVFTRCTGPCPQVTRTMAELQTAFAREPDVLLVTFTVDPAHDDPHELAEYAKLHGADPKRWLFLTGPEEKIYELVNKQFHLAAKPNEGKARKSGAEVMHDTHLAVVDRRGRLRGYYEGLRDARSHDPEGEYRNNLRKLKAKVGELVHEDDPWYQVNDFPRLNALLNAISAALLLLGYAAIRGRLVRLHVACMLTALAVSAAFLTSYLYYHVVVKHGQPTYFHDQAVGAPEWAYRVYQGVLGSHTLLAVVVAPLALYTAWLGLRGRLTRHVRVARWTLPVWLYVSVTGVVVYWMLYRLYPGP